MKMEINDYQNNIRNFINYPPEIGPFTVILSLQDNLGKLSEKINKSLIEEHGGFTKEGRTKIAISLGDILFDISNMAYDLGYTLNDIISLNIMKHTMEKEKEEKEKSTDIPTDSK